MENNPGRGAQNISYVLAREWSRWVRAIAIVESGENPGALGDGGRAFGLLQMHPARFCEEFARLRYTSSTLNFTWTDAQILVCAEYLRRHRTARVDLSVQGWRLGANGVWLHGERDEKYWAAVRAAYDSLAPRPPLDSAT